MNRLTTLLFILLSFSGMASAEELERHPLGSQAPPLALDDLGGNNHALEDYRGQVVLVNFWASWCAPCLLEMPDMQRLKQAMEGKPFTILAVNVRESPGTIWKFQKNIHVDFPLLLDREGHVSTEWQIDLYPTSFLLDPEGRIRLVAYGPRQWDAQEYQNTINEMLETVQHAPSLEITRGEVDTGNASHRQAGP